MAYTTLIQPAELAVLLRDGPTRTLVCDCTFDLADPAAGRRTYEAGHVPGAAYLSLDEALSGPATGANGRHPLPDRDAFAAAMAALGASEDTQVVAYDATDGMYAARLWAMMRWLGHAGVAVLDGGMTAWRAAGQPLDAAPFAAPARGRLEPRPSLVPVVDYAAVLAASGAGGRLILDARSAPRFRGEGETMDPVGGHMPGARNRSFRFNVTADNRFKPAAELRREFTEVLGGRPARDVVSSCGSGVTACHNMLAMEVAGLGGAALYPGSWSEWSAQPGAPVATGDA